MSDAVAEKTRVTESRDLANTYDMGKLQGEARRHVDLDIEENQFIAVMGPSGSGKSTLMNLLGCLDTPTTGSYRLNGTEVSNLDDNELAAVRNREIGFVFQTFNLLPRATAMHNVELPLIYAGMSARERKQRALHALEMTGLADRADHRPNELSGGQRQRVAVARARVNQPASLRADEPTGNLDSKTGARVMGMLSGLNARGKTLIMVTHEPQIAGYATTRIHMRDGMVDNIESKN